ncbi:exonuclease [Trypanosoma brucei equiperdum]|uniref:Exonuclease n=1 Tax=Trypanosoma brucei equiperdum TaxID=630700 RepID=A0A3L6LA72_9TRYP|nr:exonuclease [Trypanosoma brucei equiperdum]
MLERLQLTFEGREHCGFDDAVNIARLAVSMMRAGCVFNYLVAIPLTDEFHYDMPNTALYRRKEGSGYLDPDVVDDIAKKCFGVDYFTFGERHMAEVMEHRRRYPQNFNQTQPTVETNENEESRPQVVRRSLQNGSRCRLGSAWISFVFVAHLPESDDAALTAVFFLFLLLFLYCFRCEAKCLGG